MDTDRLVNIGYGNFASCEKIMAVLSPDSAPIKRFIQDTREKGMLIDATYGRKTRGVIIMDNGYVILSAMLPDTIGSRLSSGKDLKH